MSEELKPRALQVGDLLATLDIVDKLLDELSDDQIAAIMNGTGDQDAARGVGFALFKAAFRRCRGDLIDLMAAVAETTVEDLSTRPASTLPKLVTAIMEDQRNADFFAELRDMLPSAVASKA